MPRPELFWLYN